jgi:hypothetical protein
VKCSQVLNYIMEMYPMIALTKLDGGREPSHVRVIPPVWFHITVFRCEVFNVDSNTYSRPQYPRSKARMYCIIESIQTRLKGIGKWKTIGRQIIERLCDILK